MAKTTLFLNLVLVLSLLLVVSMAQGARLFDIGFGKVQSTPHCETAFGVREDDTCFAITQLFNVTTEFFNLLNPNLNCTNLFVGEGLCVAGIVELN